MSVSHEMSISKDTIEILSNFAKINEKLFVRKGNRIKTISPERNAFAIANVSETFPVDFGIIQLSRFLSSVSMYKNPVFVFNDNDVRFGEGSNTTTNYYADSSLFDLNILDKELTMPEAPIRFELSSECLADIFKAASILPADDLSVVSNGDDIDLLVHYKGNETSNKFRVKGVGSSNGQSFTINFGIRYLKIIQDDYDVEIAADRIAKFTSKNRDLVYYIGTDADSSYSPCK